MATTNELLDRWRETLEKILQYYADLPYRYGDVRLRGRQCSLKILFDKGCSVLW